MKNTANTTEYKALSIIARIVKDFENLHFLVVAMDTKLITVEIKNLF